MATTRRAALIGSLSALFAACGGGGGSADGGSSGGALKGSTQSMSMTAASNSLSYPISIYLPPNSAADRTSLPVIYALDGDWRFATLTQLLDAFDTGSLAGAGNMLLEHVREGITPRLAGEPLHQAGERVG